MKAYLLLLVFCLSSFLASAQNHHTYFSDQAAPIQVAKINLSYNKGPFFYVYANSRLVTDSLKMIAVVLKCDTAGRTIWTAYPHQYAFNDSLHFNVNWAGFQLIHGSDSALYMLNNADSASNNKRVYISKIDDRKGDVKWVKKAVDFGLGYTADHSYVRITDYTPGELLLSGYVSATNYRVAKISKTNGSTIAVKDFAINQLNFDWYYGPRDSTKQLYVSAAGNMYIFSSDTCYKYTSFENNVLEWKVKMGYSFGDIKRIFESNNVLYIAGSKLSSANGVITAIDMQSGTKKWDHLYFSNNPNVSNINFYDAIIQNDLLYTTWHNRFEGSVSEKCFVNVSNINTGATVWQKNFDFNEGIPTSSTPQGMESMDIDANGTLFLTGHASNIDGIGNSTYDWAVMKIAGSNGVLLGKARIPKTSATLDSKGRFIRRFGSTLYVLGFESYFYELPRSAVKMVRMDTATLTIGHTLFLRSAIQYPTAVHAVQDFSAGKKLVVLNTGRRLELQMKDNNLGGIWTKMLGDTLNLYQGSAAIGVARNKLIYVAAKRYKPLNTGTYPIVMNEYHANYSEWAPQLQNDSLFIFVVDSNGNNVNTVRLKDDLSYTPIRFISDGDSNRLYFEYMRAASTSPVAYPPVFMHETVLPDQFGRYYSGNTFSNAPERAEFVKPRNSYELPGDSVIFFETRFSDVSRVKKVTYAASMNGSNRVLPNVRIIYDVEKFNGNTFFMAGQDSLKNDFLMRLHSGTGQVWRKTFDTSQNHVKVMEMDGSLYTLVKKGKNYFIHKYAATDGTPVWNHLVPVPAHNYFIPKDFILNRQQKTITVAGSISDSSLGKFPFSKTAYAYTVDENNTEIYRFKKTGDLEWSNEASQLYVDRNYRTFTMGRTHYKMYGYAGFIGEAEKPSVYVTAGNGAWQDAATWVGGMVPPPDAEVLILHSITIASDVTCRVLNVQAPNGYIIAGTGVNIIITN